MANQKKELESTAESAEPKKETKVEFNDSDNVIVKGTEDKKFSMKVTEEYKVSGKMAKILISKGAAEFVKIIK